MLVPPREEQWPKVGKFRLIPHAMAIEDHQPIERWIREIGGRLASANWLRSFRRSFPRPVGVAGTVVFGGKSCQWKNPGIGNSAWVPVLKPDSVEKLWVSDILVMHLVPPEARWLVEILP